MTRRIPATLTALLAISLMMAGASLMQDSQTGLEAIGGLATSFAGLVLLVGAICVLAQVKRI